VRHSQHYSPFRPNGAGHGLALDKDFAVSPPLFYLYGGVEPTSLRLGSSRPFGLMGLRPRASLIAPHSFRKAAVSRYLCPSINYFRNLQLDECPDFPPDRWRFECLDQAIVCIAKFSMHHNTGMSDLCQIQQILFLLELS
jgi:hypothetical protein